MSDCKASVGLKVLVLFNIIDGALLKDMFFCAAHNLENNKPFINDLNVYPVPDGDTGTNMTLTMQSALKEVSKVTDLTATNLANAVSTGALKGARGNSGVILSQLFRGFAKSLSGKTTINVEDFAIALKAAADNAYKAVMKPSEGTILTVARVTAEKAMELRKRETQFERFFEAICAAAKAALDATPDMLPVLKQAGVVDSGGMGFYCIICGFEMALKDDYVLDLKEYETSAEKQFESVNEAEFVDDHSLADIKFTYCTEFFVYESGSIFPSNIEDLFKEEFAPKGDSMLVIHQDGVVKTHIHTNAPLEVLSFAMKYGALQDVKIENMRLQNEELNASKKEKEPKKEVGIVVISMGDGISEIFKSLGADVIVGGGQTMNPSIEDIVHAVDKANAEHVFVFPNNKNIILAAEQAKDIVQCDMRVIPTKSVQQCISALIMYNPDDSLDDNENMFNEVSDKVVYGQITNAVRDTVIEDVDVHEGDYIALVKNKLKVSGPDIVSVAKEMFAQMISEDSSLVTIYYGEDATEELANVLADYVRQTYEYIDAEVYNGGQPVYNLLVSVD